MLIALHIRLLLARDLEHVGCFLSKSVQSDEPSISGKSKGVHLAGSGSEHRILVWGPRGFNTKNIVEQGLLGGGVRSSI